jgi:hypothetical protein
MSERSTARCGHSHEPHLDSPATHGPLLHIPTVCSASHTPLPILSRHSCAAPAAAQRRPAPTHALPPTPLCRFVCTERGGRHQRRSLPLHWCRYVDSACSSGITSQHFSAGPSLAQPSQRGRLQRPAAVLRQPLLSCFSVVAHRAGARVRGAAVLHRLYSARTLCVYETMSINNKLMIYGEFGSL